MTATDEKIAKECPGGPQDLDGSSIFNKFKKKFGEGNKR